MGLAINIECERCRYHGSFMLGTGNFYTDLENCLEAFPPERVGNAAAIFKENLIRSYVFSYHLFQCTDCYFLFDYGDLRVVFENDKMYLQPIECPRCQKDMRGKDTPIEEVHHLTCPVCLHQGGMFLVETMEWD